MAGARPTQAALTRDNDLSQTEHTRSVVEGMVDGLNDHVVDGIGAFFAADFRWIGNAGCGTKNGLREFQDNWQRPFQAAFSDKVCIDEARLAEGEWMAAFGRQEATHTGTFMGIAPTGKRVEIRYMDFWKVRDGKIVDNWVMVDFPHVLRQLGVDPFDGHGWEAFDTGRLVPPGPGLGEMVSSIDVARVAGVSQSAVSRVFTPGASVSARMRRKVLDAAAGLQYRPNNVARSLTTGRSRIIGLVVAYLDNQYYPIAVERLSKALQRRGYHVLMFMTEQTASNIDDVMAEILDYQVDGIIVASVAMSSKLADRCADAAVPVVLFNRLQNEDRFSSVVSDNAWGGQMQARFLAAGGHERIAYLAGWEGASTQRDREAGFRAGLDIAGHALFARDCGNYTYADAQAATRRMFGVARRPDAVFVCNDHMAIATLDVLRYELGLRVPGDVSVVAYDDVPQAAWPSYSLTSIRQPTDDMVAAAVIALIDRIENGSLAPHRVCLRGPLIVRGSAKVPADWSRLETSFLEESA